MASSYTIHIHRSTCTYFIVFFVRNVLSIREARSVPPTGSPSYVFSRAYIAIRFLLLGFRISVSQCSREGERERTAETKPKPEFLQPRLPEIEKEKPALIGRWRCCRESRGFCSSRERGGKDKIRRVGKHSPPPFRMQQPDVRSHPALFCYFPIPSLRRIAPTSVQRWLHSNKCARSTDFSPKSI